MRRRIKAVGVTRKYMNPYYFIFLVFLVHSNKKSVSKAMFLARVFLTCSKITRRNKNILTLENETTWNKALHAAKPKSIVIVVNPTRLLPE